jgi:hypothetical protein
VTRAVTAAAVHEPRSRPSFRERVHMLAGKSAYREPAQGSSEQRAIPADHIVAAALAFGRVNPGDVGPDIAFDMATGRPGHYRRVCEWLGRQLATEAQHRGGRLTAVRRVGPLTAHYAVWAYNATVRGWQCPPAPDGITPEDHGEALLFACLLLERAAEDALSLAARRARG